MSSFAPFLPGALADAAVGLAGGGGTLGVFCVAVGCADAGGAASIGGLLFVAARFGSDPRPGGGGGGLLARSPGLTARIAPEPGGADGDGVVGAGGGAATIAPVAELDGRVGGPDAGSGGGCDADAGSGGGALGAGPGIPRSVFFASRAAGRDAGTCAEEPGGGGGAAAERSDFFPRPSKMSRSDPPPLLLSFDIRVS